MQSDFSYLEKTGQAGVLALWLCETRHSVWFSVETTLLHLCESFSCEASFHTILPSCITALLPSTLNSTEVPDYLFGLKCSPRCSSLGVSLKVCLCCVVNVCIGSVLGSENKPPLFDTGTRDSWNLCQLEQMQGAAGASKAHTNTAAHVRKHTCMNDDKYADKNTKMCSKTLSCAHKSMESLKISTEEMQINLLKHKKHTLMFPDLLRFAAKNLCKDERAGYGRAE